MRPQAAHVRSMRRWRWRASLKCSRHSESFSGMTRFMPRYSTLGIARSRSVVEDQGRAGWRHRPAEVHGDAGVLDLPATPARVVVGVPALGGALAVVVD